MAQLLGCQSVAKAYGARTLFTDLTLALQDGDRLGLVGPNGAGKSTLLAILAGLERPDSGIVTVRRGVRMAHVPQSPTFSAELSVRDALEAAADGDGATDHSQREAHIQRALGWCGFVDDDAMVPTLSGGWQKRLAIACALVREPDVVLFDEPGNHLDLESVLWLEELLRSSRFASIIVSHDRYLLENVATRMCELSRAYPGGIFASDGGYSQFLSKKDAFLTAQSQQEDSLRTRVRRELEWLSRGAKARTTKSKARIDNAHELRLELDEVHTRNSSSGVRIDFDASGRKTKRLLVAEDLSLTLGGRPLFRDVSFILKPRFVLGLVGPNGGGKTSLLRVLQRELEPDSGEVRRVDGLAMVYFSQSRVGFDPKTSLRRALAPEGDTVIFQDKAYHVASWARRFQFPDDRLESPIGTLSGGELARVHIARMVLEPADVLLLDEPTNDLDIATLEVLEESLEAFPGAIILVTHDRYLLDRLSDAVLGLHGDGSATIYADYVQWEEESRAREQSARKVAPTKKSAPATGSSTAPSGGVKPRKRLGYLEQRELDQLEGKIEKAEEQQSRAQTAIAEPAIASDPKALQAACGELDRATAEVERLYARWAELEAKLS